MMRPRASAGFTLVELMVVVAIIGILAAIVYPAYIDQVRTSRRAEAKSLLHAAMEKQERYYTRNSAYTVTYASVGFSSTPVRSRTGWYQLSMSFCSGSDPQCIQLNAAPRNDQANDDCGTFTLDSVGRRATSSGSGNCW